MTATRALSDNVTQGILRLRRATDATVSAIHAAGEVDEELLTFKAALEHVEAHALRDGLVEGRNEAERKAHLQVLTEAPRSSLLNAQRNAARARARLEAARLELDLAREELKATHLLAALAGAKGA